MSADSLAEEQHRFLQRIQEPGSSAVPESIARGRLSGELGMRIYGNAYTARLREALDSDHPALGSYLGDLLWLEMCEGYILAHPSQCRSLRDFAARLPAYLARTEPFKAHPEIVELANFERSLLHSFDSADCTPADWQELLRLPPDAWPSLRLHFCPSLCRHRTASNSVEIWNAISQGGAPPAATATVNTAWVIWRDADRISRFRSLDEAQGDALDHALAGGDFSGLCAGLLRWHEQAQVPGIALSYLHDWCTQGWLSGWD